MRPKQGFSSAKSASTSGENTSHKKMSTLPYLQGIISVAVKPNSSCTEIVSFDEKEKLLKINLKAKPQGNKANTELVKFLKKLTKKQVRIKSGLKSRKKIVEIS